MKQSIGRRGGAWFWVGVTLLTISAISWLIIILVVLDRSQEAGSVILGGLAVTVIPVGIGIYGIIHGRKFDAVETDIITIMKTLSKREQNRYEEDLNKKLAIARLAESKDNRVTEALHHFINLRESGRLKSAFPGNTDDIILAIHGLVRLGDKSIARRAALSWYFRDYCSGIMHRAVSAGVVPKEPLLIRFQEETDSEEFYREVLELLGESVKTDDQLLETLIEQMYPVFSLQSWNMGREKAEANIRVEYIVEYAECNKAIELIKVKVDKEVNYLSMLKTQLGNSNFTKQMRELYDMWYYPNESGDTRAWARKEWERLKSLKEDSESSIKKTEERIAGLSEVLRKLGVNE
ncbi:MAG: hypothetical protein ISS54_05470 [Dehalococcoidia bacterium]|nr:hypothetical protein [Dehalococcoidia bacterium]